MDALQEQRRRLRIAGRTEWIVLEREFWESLEDIAEQLEISMEALTARVVLEGEVDDVPAALRVFVLMHARAEGETAMFERRREVVAESSENATLARKQSFH